MFGWTQKSRSGTKRMMERSGAYDGGATGVMTGIIVGTRVATAIGWRDVGALGVGDRVLTFDGGLQTVERIERQLLWNGKGACPQQFWPLMVPEGALDNAKPMRVLPRQGVMLESDTAETVFGDPFALIPALALEGVHGIERVFPNDPIEVITLHFSADHVVFAEEGALFFCPASQDLIESAVQEARDCFYRMLPESCALALVSGSKEARDFMPCAA